MVPKTTEKKPQTLYRHFYLHFNINVHPLCLLLLSKPLIMSQTTKTHGTDAKDKGVPAPAASSKSTKTGEPGMGSYRVSPWHVVASAQNGLSTESFMFLEGQFSNWRMTVIMTPVPWK